MNGPFFPRSSIISEIAPCPTFLTPDNPNRILSCDTVKISSEIPFDEDVYIRYLSCLVECEIQINNYPKEFKQKLNSLAEAIYPLLPGTNQNKKNKKTYSSTFSDGMNSILDNMRKKY